MINILIVNDQLITRKGIISLLSNEIDINVVGEANNCEEIFELLLQNQTYDLIVMTMSLATRDGYTSLKRLIKQYPNLPVLLLNVCPGHYSVLQTIKLRVNGYLDKSVKPENFIQAIRKVATNGVYISETLAEKVALKQTERTTLSKREYQILCMIAAGKTPKDIAKILCISIKSISAHKSRILQKLNLDCDAELIRYAIENNLIET